MCEELAGTRHPIPVSPTRHGVRPLRSLQTLSDPPLHTSVQCLRARAWRASDHGGRGGTLGWVIIHENAATLLVKMGEVRTGYAELYAAQHPASGGPEREPERASWAVFSEVLRRLVVEEARATVSGRCSSGGSRGPDTSADVGESLLVLARIEVAQHHVTEARPLLSRALRCFTTGIGADAPATAQVRGELARS
jgi:hypothetical protein